MIEYKEHRFEKNTILHCLRWYLAYPLSYRYLEEMVHERGIEQADFVDPENYHNGMN